MPTNEETLIAILDREARRLRGEGNTLGVWFDRVGRTSYELAEDSIAAFAMGDVPLGWLLRQENKTLGAEIERRDRRARQLTKLLKEIQARRQQGWADRDRETMCAIGRLVVAELRDWDLLDEVLAPQVKA